MLTSVSQSTPAVAVVNETILGAHPEEYRRMLRWLDDRVTASKKAPSAEIVTLTPVLAKLLLARNKGNRPLSSRNSTNIASDIANGRWVFNGESIVVSSSGDLIDGQHRCEQVVATGKSIQVVIVFGPRDEARFTIDTGKAKSAANFMAMKHYKYSVVLAAAIGYLVRWKDPGYIATSGHAVPTTAEKLIALEANPGMKGSVEFTATCMKTIRAHAVLAFCHYDFARRAGRALADEFIQKLIDGDGLKKGDAIYYCRNRLIHMERGYAANDRCELIFKCWNKWRTGGTVTTFRFTGGKLPKVER
jgi:hypothetical protein